jgi:uncharacterized protein YndB with AHSA1/START domain
MEQFGEVQKLDDGFKVTFERHLDHDIETVWEAITDPKKLKYWFTDIEMEHMPGGKMNIIFRDAGKTVTSGEIVKIEKPFHFVWTWEGELADWRLIPEGKNKCKLVFTYSKMSDQYAVGAAGGFHTLVSRLEQFLNGDKTIYPFGTEEFDPEQELLREKYGEKIFKDHPELEAHNPVRIERILNAPVEKVWSALTERDQLKKWYFDFPETFVLNPGQQFDWWAGPPDGKQWLHRGKIVEVIKNKKLVHTWEFPGYTGHSELSWELNEFEKNKTRLLLIHKFIIPFDLKEDALRRRNFVTGWKQIMESLADFIQRSQ